MKKCKVCNASKKIEEFDIKSNGYVSGYCKECRRERMKEHYRNNKTYYIKKASKGRDREAEKYISYKKTLNCFDCEISFKDEPYLCDFHHPEGEIKSQNAGSLRGQFKKFIKEIKNCIPLCANCHRRRHFKQD